MTVTWTNVYSTNVSQVGYDTETRELLVRWDSGKVSAYAGVDEALATEAAKSWSVGSFVARSIKPRFPHRYRTDLP